MDHGSNLETVYNPQAVEKAVYESWEAAGAFRSQPDDTPHDKTFTIVIPPPNVTGALHLGHALNNTLQDILIRYYRMRGFNTLWQPGCDHAGIATQAVVERRIRETEGKNRHDIGREELVKRIWKWKDEYEDRIIGQLKEMGCSCDWERTRFTLDEGLVRAVRHQFFHLFKDGLIFRGKRLVNWDTDLQTAVANDEVYHETVEGHFWHFRYPVIDPKPGEPEHVVIATTRPETMLGDTAVAVHPDPKAFFAKQEAALRESMVGASEKESPEIEAKIETLTARRSSHLEGLIKLADMARGGKRLRLPLVEREIPLITDDWADPSKGSGCVKITPAHDSNDYEVGVRNDLPMINVLTVDGKIARIVEADGSVNSHSGDYEGLDFSGAGREKVVADLEARGLIESIEDHKHEVGHSDRSKTPIEPFLSDQWFVKTEDVATERRSDEATKGVRLGDGSHAPGLAQAAIDVVENNRARIFPGRYAKSYGDWLAEKRDWCISRQLWWGHRIPVWEISISTATLAPPHELDPTGRAIDERISNLKAFFEKCQFGEVSIMDADWEGGRRTRLYVCGKDARADDAIALAQKIIAHKSNATTDELREYSGFRTEVKKQFGDDALASIDRLRDGVRIRGRDPDVLDTWFSSALWPFSTLGWPEKTDHLKQYYPGSVLITSRDIITNWVARMVMFGLYAMGDVPFDHVYIHPKILDGRGETMSKSKGNGVDPVDIIRTHGADALRYTMADMTTETQDIRMPVEYVCPRCSKLVDQGAAIKAETQARKSRGEKLDRKLQPADCKRVKCTNKECGREFATQWADEETKAQIPVAHETSDKFDIGRNFCNKLWNAARFAFMNLEGTTCDTIDVKSLPSEDRWILAKLSQTVRRYHKLLQTYQYSASIRELREFFWDCLCDWYIELTKPRMSGDRGEQERASARQVLAFCLDQSLRLFHPTMPFITEKLWSTLNDTVSQRGLPGAADLTCDTQLVIAPFPPENGYPALDDDAIVETFGELQDITRGVRELRNAANISPKDKVSVTVAVQPEDAEAIERQSYVVRHMAGIDEFTVDVNAKRPKNSAAVNIHGLRIFVHDISDDEAERRRTAKTLEQLEKQIAGRETKLSNEKFLAGAKPDVVDAERKRLDAQRQEREALTTHLAELS